MFDEIKHPSLIQTPSKPGREGTSSRDSGHLQRPDREQHAHSESHAVLLRPVSRLGRGVCSHHFHWTVYDSVRLPPIMERQGTQKVSRLERKKETVFTDKLFDHLFRNPVIAPKILLGLISWGRWQSTRLVHKSRLDFHMLANNDRKFK